MQLIRDEGAGPDIQFLFHGEGKISNSHTKRVKVLVSNMNYSLNSL